MVALYAQHQRDAVRTDFVLVKRFLDDVAILVKQSCEFVHAARVLVLCHAKGRHGNNGRNSQNVCKICFHRVNFFEMVLD